MRAPHKEPDRVILALVVGGVHLIIWWLAREWVPTPRAIIASDDAGSVLLMLPEKTGALEEHRQKPASPVQRLLNIDRLLKVPALDLSQDESNAITLPANDQTVDWNHELEGAATSSLEKSRINAQRSSEIGGRPEPSPNLRPLHEPKRDYDWYVQHSHQVINEHGVPEWVLTQPCPAEELKADPSCTIDHVEKHGVMFEYMQQEHDSKLRYDGPNAVP